jgi:hypothetical protein
MAERASRSAAAGIAYLDTSHPGWQSKIPETVDISNPNCCVLAHLVGGQYQEGVRLLGIEHPESLGFFVRGDQRSIGVKAQYALLTLRFKTARNNRLRTEVSSPQTGAANTREKEMRELVGV